MKYCREENGDGDNDAQNDDEEVYYFNEMKPRLKSNFWMICEFKYERSGERKIAMENMLQS